MSDSSPDPVPCGLGPRLLGEVATMVRFYSRLPLPRLGPGDVLERPAPFARALRVLPISALIVAAPGAVVIGLLALSNLAAIAVAALGLAVTTIVTGAFHEDGLADVSDAFAGGATPERRLEIMKDSRIGAFGGTALAAQFVIRTALLADLVGRSGWTAALVMATIVALARILPPTLMLRLDPARPDGLGRAVGRPEPQALAIGIALAVAMYAAAAGFTLGLGSAAIGLAVAVAALTAHAALAKAKIGGYTGDVIGAGTPITEIATLTGLLL